MEILDIIIELGYKKNYPAICDLLNPSEIKKGIGRDQEQNFDNFWVSHS